MDEAWDAWLKTTVDDSGDGVPDIWGLRWGQGTWWGDYEPASSALCRPGRQPDLPGHGRGRHHLRRLPRYAGSDRVVRGLPRLAHRRPRRQPARAGRQIFFNKGAAFYVSPDNAIGTINRLYPDGDFNYGVTGIPYEDGAQVCHTGSWHVGVSPQTRTWSSPWRSPSSSPGRKAPRSGTTPCANSRRGLDLLNTLPEYQEYPQQMFAEGLTAIGIPRIQTPGYTEYQQIFAELVQNVATGEGVEVAPLVQDAAVQMEQALAKYEGWQEE